MPNPLEEGKDVEGVKVGDGGEGSNLKVVHNDSVVINENGENKLGHKRQRSTKIHIGKSKRLHNKCLLIKIKGIEIMLIIRKLNI